jgi:ABC-type multidrug transport system ATPase subunit
MIALLRFCAVRKSLWRGAHEIRVLDGIDFEVHEGELVAVWGSRAAGKSTLARIAVGLESPDGGSVLFAGRDLGRMSRKEHSEFLRREVGWAQRVGAESDLELRMLDWVAKPLVGNLGRRVSRRLAADILAQTGLRGCEGKLWEELTDGERTLVAIARALVRRPRLLVIDDPTANLDMIECRAVMGLLRRRAEQDGLGVLVTVPEMSDVLQAHRWASLSGGRIVVPREPADGPRGELSKAADRPAEVIDLPDRRRSV